MKFKSLLSKNKWMKLKKAVFRGFEVLQNQEFIDSKKLTELEASKIPKRTAIINFFIDHINAKNYLEIGVRNPEANFDKIVCKYKYSVDPGIESVINHAIFKVTSDVFFENLSEGEFSNLLTSNKFDVIFIDGLHTAEQVESDIANSLKFLNENGVIILHDCNPPTEHHQRENYNFKLSPARIFWNGTTWKAYYKTRYEEGFYTACFDTDWGVGVISKKLFPGFNQLKPPIRNSYFSYSELEKNRQDDLNLLNFNDWKDNIMKI